MFFAHVVLTTAHAASVVTAAKQTPNQWKSWYWICVGALVFFLLSIPMMRGRWSPAKAKEDEREHEELIREEMKTLELV